MKEERIVQRCAVLEERKVNEEQLVKAESHGPANDEKVMKARNELTHEGDFIGDIRAITHSEANGWPHVSKYKEGFLKSYRISFADALEKAPLLPIHVVRMFSIRASINELDEWQNINAQEKKTRIENLIEDIVRPVLSMSSEKLEKFFEKGEVLDKIDKVDQLFLMRD